MTISKLKTYLINNWPIYLLVLLGVIIPLRWFSDGRIIGGGDHFIYYNPTNIFYDYFYTWIERVNLGEPNMEVQLIFPFLSFFMLFKLIGLSNVNSEILWAIYQFLFAGIFIYVLVTYLIGHKDIYVKISGFVAGVFYMFNTNTMLDPLPIGARPIYTALPLLVFLWVKGLREVKTNSKYSILFSLSTLLIASSNGGPAFIAPVLISIFLYTLYFLVYHDPRKISLGFIAKTVVLTIIFNLWWVVPSSFAFDESGQATADYIRNIANFTQSTLLWEAFRLMGFWAFRIQSSLGMEHIPYARFYYTFPLVLISYIFPAIALFGLAIGKIKKELLIFPVMLIAGVFLAKGVNPPLGGIFDYVYQHISIFSIFRNPYSKFTLLSLFALSITLGVSWYSILNILRKNLRITLTCVLLGLNLLIAFPMIVGSSFQDPSWHNTTIDSQHVDIPPYWYDIGEWFAKNDPEARVIQFPKFTYGSCYNWPMGSCSGEPAGRMFLPNQVLKYPGIKLSYRDYVITNAYDEADDGEVKNIAPLLGYLGVKYVLQQNDYAWYYGSNLDATPERMAALFRIQKNLSYTASFGKLDIYEVDRQFIYPQVYLIDKLTYINNDATRAGELIDFNRNISPQTYLFNSDDSFNYQPQNDTSIPKIILIDKINPTRIKITITGAEGPFYLVSLNSYSRYWKARIIPPGETSIISEITGNIVSESNHFLANGYANGWLLSPKAYGVSTNFTIILDYYPQNYYYLALFISSLSIILSLLFLLIKKSLSDKY